MRKRALITGGAGFIGSHLADLLFNEGYEVVVMDNLFTGSRENVRNHSRVEFMRHDVCEPFHIDVDEIYHLACPASPVHYQRNPVRTIETCVLGTSNALKCARDVGARIFIASTSEIYGDPLEHPQKETYWGNVNTVGPRSCYDEGKRAGEALAMSYVQQHGVDVRIARIFNTYGPRMQVDDGRVVSNFLVQALRRQPLTVQGTGEQTRSFCFVEDLVKGIYKLGSTPKNDLRWIIMNLGNPFEVTINQLVDEVKRLVPNITIDKRPAAIDDPARRKPDISRATEALAWSPRVILRQGLLETFEYFRAKLAEERAP